MSIVSISGKLNVGKDTVGKIWQIIDGSPHFTTKGIMEFLNKPYDSRFEIKKWADSLKDMVCILLGCTRGQLEDREFKEKELGGEWWYWENSFGKRINYLDNTTYGSASKERLTSRNLIKLTPRLLMQILGTEAGRNLIHPNIWVNVLMSRYQYKIGFAHGNYWCKCGECGKQFSGDKRAVRCETCSMIYPKWIITDTRFPNELKAVKDRGGITIRVDRHIYKSTIEKIKPYSDYLNYGIPIPIEHKSETSLDNATFDYYINNNGSLEELIEEVVKIYQDVKKNKLL